MQDRREGSDPSRGDGVRGCAGARVRGCAGARVRGCAGARVRNDLGTQLPPEASLITHSALAYARAVNEEDLRAASP